jgi:hypothetical protein
LVVYLNEPLCKISVVGATTKAVSVMEKCKDVQELRRRSKATLLSKRDIGREDDRIR